MTLNAKDAESLAFEHRARQFYIRCAKHVISLAPLPEFKDALATLEAYDKSPTEQGREQLKKAYRTLTSNRTRRNYGYTAVGEFYIGLRFILYHTLYRRDSVTSSCGTYFTETVWCAGRALHCNTANNQIEYLAQGKESQWQDALWIEIFESDRTAQKLPAAV